jgi:hypothetical protein
MSDDFERRLRDHLHNEAAQVPQLPRELRGRIRNGVQPRRGFSMRAPQLAFAAAAGVLAGALFFGVRNEQVIINALPAGIRQLIQPTPTPQPFVCTDRSGGNPSVSTQVTDIRWARHDGYDRVVVDFSSGIPSYDLTRQPTANFVQDPSGQPVALDGSAGVKLILRNTDGSPSLAPDSKPEFPALREVTQLGAFEGVLSYGMGLAAPTCDRVLELSGPPRLVIDFATSGPAPSASATPTLAPSATALGQFQCVDASGGKDAGQVQLKAIRTAHQPGYDRIVYEFSPSTGAVPPYTVTRQSSTHFVKDPSGQPVTLRGSYGLRLVLRNTTAYGAYQGSSDLTPGLPALLEAAQLGDFEGVNSWGLGLARNSCMRVLELSNPTRLVIDIQTP